MRFSTSDTEIKEEFGYNTVDFRILRSQHLTDTSSCRFKLTDRQSGECRGTKKSRVKSTIQPAEAGDGWVGGFNHELVTINEKQNIQNIKQKMEQRTKDEN